MLTSDLLNSTNQYAMHNELKWVRNHTKTLKPHAVVVMLGAGPGVLGLAAVEGNPLIDLYIIDIYTTHWAKAHLESVGYLQGDYIIRDSAETGQQWSPLLPVDFLIIDADHTREAVLKDISAWFPHVIEGGYIFFHDYLERDGGFSGGGEWKPKGVAHAIWESVDDKWKYIDSVGISTVYKKVG